MIDPQPDLELTAAQAERIVGEWLRQPVNCSEPTPLSGGMINTVLRLDFDRPPHRAVIKLHGTGTDTFKAEAQALEFLHAETTSPVPGVYLHDDSARLIPYAYLLLEHFPGMVLDKVDVAPAERADLDRQLAGVVADLHTHTGNRWGPVAGEPHSRTWAEIFFARLSTVRAAPALDERLAPEVLTSVDRAIELVPALLGDSNRPTLVHGDIWDGNLIVNRDGDRWQLAALLDPDLQYADPEYELAYLEVFDNPRPDFFAAYTERHPLRDGYEQRRLAYWLHTALLHVALFEEEFFREFTARTAAAIGHLR